MRCIYRPNRTHLLALLFQKIFGKISFTHGIVVENMLCLSVFNCPNQIFVACRKISATKIWGGIWFEPSYVVEYLESKLLDSISALKNRVICSRYPQCSFWLQYSATCRNPGLVEFKVGFYSIAFVPVAFIYRDRLPRLAGKSTIRQHIRRVGENHINRIRWNLFHYFKAIPIYEPKVPAFKVIFHNPKYLIFTMPLQDFFSKIVLILGRFPLAKTYN